MSANPGPGPAPLSAPQTATLELPDPAATRALGERLYAIAARAAPAAAQGLLITLDGPLGAGKSSLARALLRAAGVAGPIPSPTFTLVEPYAAAGLRFYHLDLYRLADPAELNFLGYDEMRVAGCVVLVEWAGRFAGLADGADMAIELGYAGAGRRARLRLAGSCSEHGALDPGSDFK